MHCNCIYDKWPWCVLVKRYTCILIYSTAHGYLIIDSLNEFFNLGERKFCKKKNSLKKNILHEEYCYQYRKVANGG